MGCLQSKNKKIKKLGYRSTFELMRIKRKKDTDIEDNDNFDDDDIAPYIPNSELLNWYKEQLEEGKKKYNLPPGVKEKFTTVGRALDIARLVKRDKTCEGTLSVNENELTFYHVTPLNYVIGRGCFSTVMLADMTVYMTTADMLAKKYMEKNLDIMSNNIKSENIFAPLLLENNEKKLVEKVLPKYLIACKEYTLVGDNAFVVYKQLRKEVLRLTRLAFSKRLLKVLQMEAVYMDLKNTEIDNNNNNNNSENNNNNGDISFLTDVLVDKSKKIYRSASVTKLNKTVNSGNDRSNNCNNNGSISSSSKYVVNALKSSSKLFISGRVQERVPSKVRIYMEYAKHGTLRNILLHEMPKKHNKTYMHELMVRAYLREVLVALAFLHENDVVHTDLCAKNIYIVNHIKNVYTTSFPAYIADIPAGRFAKVPAVWVHRVLALMDPACMQPQYNLGHIGQVPNDSVLPHLGRVPQEEDDKEENNNNNNNNNNNMDDNVDGLRVDNGTCNFVDEEVKMYLQDNAYIDADNLHVPSPLSSVEADNVFKTSEALTGMTVVRSGSFSKSPLVPASLVQRSYTHFCVDGDSDTTITANNNNSNNNNSCNEKVDCSFATNAKRPFNIEGIHHDGKDAKPVAPDMMATDGRHFEQFDRCLSTVTSAACRKRRPLIKLGRYGKICSILVGDDASNVHKLGRVTHFAPEVLNSSCFTPASDIYAFAMTFIELTTPNDALFEDQRPKEVSFSKSQQKEMEYDALWLSNIRQFLSKNNYEVPLPSHLSAKCKAMLRMCLARDPAKRPTAVELLQSTYFLLGHWVNVATKTNEIEAPWQETNYEAAAQAAGLPVLPSDLGLYNTGAFFVG